MSAAITRSADSKGVKVATSFSMRLSLPKLISPLNCFSRIARVARELSTAMTRHPLCKRSLIAGLLPDPRSIANFPSPKELFTNSCS